MTRTQWVEHIEETESIVRPGKGGSLEAWRAAVILHVVRHCPDCAKRACQVRANKRAKAVRQCYADLGMTRVRGALGGVYYE